MSTPIISSSVELSCRSQDLAVAKVTGSLAHGVSTESAMGAYLRSLILERLDSPVSGSETIAIA